MVQRHYGGIGDICTYEQGELRGIEGEERRGKEMDGCPLTTSVYLHRVEA
jgi:hypothetical protein